MSGYNTYLVSPNLQSNGIYTGNCIAFESSGGFIIESVLPEIQIAPLHPLSQFDVTDAVQMKFSLRQLNDQLGIIKDDSNIAVLEIIDFDASNQVLQTDSVEIDAADFLNCVITQNILSVGKLSTIYSEFNQLVTQYFSQPNGLNTLFSYTNMMQVTNRPFDEAAFVNLLNGITFNIDGYYITDLSGSFQVFDVNNHLKYVCDTDIFNNRRDTSNNIYDVTYGFMEGDLIFIPNGITITMYVDIQANEYENILIAGSNNLLQVNNTLNYTDLSRNVSKHTEFSLTTISQTVTVPLLLILTGKDIFTFDQFGSDWIDVTTVTVGNRGWLSISISATGQFQAAVNTYGDIYISNDYGVLYSWNYVYNIGKVYESGVNPNLSNAIAVSANGRFITASNGHSIYVSNNYGDTNSWELVQSITTTNVFVCISLNGQYQSVISCGDTMYSSSDYGHHWSALPEQFIELYNSIQIFQYAGICISFNGKYQCIACEFLYFSNDYGTNWNIVPISHSSTGHDYIDNRNWTGVSISTDGKYMTAINSGGFIYTSSNYGVDWGLVQTSEIGENLWTGISISVNGKYQTVLNTQSGHIYISTNYGSYWRRTLSPVVQNHNFQAVSVSANGQYQSAVANGGAIYTSNLTIYTTRKHISI
jgi:photosystem II stability/assembly factor-like uncharacterized protein